MEERDDLVHASKISQLIEKSQSKSLVIAMCGHFSAGKSSLINALCGAQILPSGPIPTSANLVIIENGASEVKVTYKQDVNNLHKETVVSIESIGELSRNGVDIEKLHIHFPIPLLSDKLVLMDTPGVDSTEDAHRLSTESA